MLVGMFHTHADPDGTQGPSPDDVDNEYYRGIPGLIRNKNGIEPYGPNRRGSVPEMALPPTDPSIKGYPGNSADQRVCDRRDMR